MITHRNVLALLLLLGCHSAHAVLINGYEFDLSQFENAAVTYRESPPGDVDFDGKLWDNFNGVDMFTLGELAAGQFGSDPGDQVTLQDRSTPDWLKLTYGIPLVISPLFHELVIFEITSSTSGVDTEGTSFRVRLNGGAFIDASSASDISHYAGSSGVTEDTNQLVFDLYDFGFSNGDIFNMLYIENTDTGSGTSDPDFIFAGIAGTRTSVAEPSTLMLLAVALLPLGLQRRRFAASPPRLNANSAA